MKPDPSHILHLIDAYRHSKTMFTAVSMGIFEMTPASLPDLAARLNANTSALERLLDGCVALNLLEKTEDRYRNTPQTETYLRRESPDTLAGYILYSDSALFRMWANLEDAIHEGTHRWTQTFGFEAPLFSHFFKTDESMTAFIRGMHGLGQLGSPAIVRAFDLSRFTKLVDLGGATGHLATAAAECWPGLKCAVFELPRVVEMARRFAGPSVELIAGDFFTDELPDADLYAVGRILHDWSEPKIDALLQKIYAKLPVGGGLLIIEKQLNEDKSGPLNANMMALNMLICTEGKERTVSEYEALLQRAGFTSVEARKTGAPVDVILAVK